MRIVKESIQWILLAAEAFLGPDASKQPAARPNLLELFGGPSVGKTTLALEAAESLKARGSNVVWFDVKGDLSSADPALLICRPACAEDAIEMIEQLCKSGAIDAMIIDPFSALVPKAESATSIGQDTSKLKALFFQKAVQQIALAAWQSQTQIILVNENGPERAMMQNTLQSYCRTQVEIKGADSDYTFLTMI